MKKCSYCDEQIQDDAKKCKFCGEWLEKGGNATSAAQLIASNTGRNSKRKNFGIGCLIILVVIIVIIIAANSGSGNKNKSSSSSNNITEGIGAPEVKERVEKQPAKPKEWVSVIKQQSSAEKQSDTFALQGGKQKIVYSLTGSMSICSVYIVKEGESLDEEGGFPEVMLTEAKSGETMARKSSGKYYLDVKPANGMCAVEVFEER